MAQVSYLDPVEQVNGRLDHQSEIYFCTRLGKRIASHYPKHKNPDKISSRQRDLASNFANAVQQCKIELADPERKAYWQERFEEQKKTAQKPYLLLRNFVIASLAKHDTNN